VKFLIDAQLPRRLALRLRDMGHDALHTRDLPLGNATPDNEIIELADRENRIVVTKDSDFVTAFWIKHQPTKLLLISTGNITNAKLEALFILHLPALSEAFVTHDFVELARTTMLVHE
jgi:predicted nuclease of predicted toxin-antitoxin system